MPVDNTSERSTFAKLVAQLATAHGGLRQEFARAIGVTPQYLSQLTADVYKAPSVELCMRIALVGHLSLRDVLLAAGRPALADMYTQLRPFEIADAIELNTASTEHSADWAALDDDTREAFRLILKAVVHEQRRGIR